MSIYLRPHPLIGTILRQIDRPWDRFKVVSVKSGCSESLSWVSPGESEFDSDPIEVHGSNVQLLEIDPDQTDGPISRSSPKNIKEN